MADQVLVIAVDVSAEALQLARENAVGHGVADRMVFVAADLLPYHVEPPYAVVCANLPYVPTDELPRLSPEIAFEPTSALDGGPDGLDVVRRLIDRLPTVTEDGGVAFLEIGAGPGRRDRAGGRGPDPERALHRDAGPGGSPEARADRPVAGVSARARARTHGRAARERPARSRPSRSGSSRSTSTGP